MPIATIPTPPSVTNVSLPPPQVFDFLPPLHSLLSRLLLPRDPADTSSPSPDTVTPISPKELGVAISMVTNKIQKARAVVRELPGVEMSISGQEAVIEELEEEVLRLDGVIERVREKAREGAEVSSEPGSNDGAMEES